MNSSTEDKPAPANLWRRDLRYIVEYATTLVQLQPTVLFIGGHIYVEPDLSEPIAEYGDLPAD